MVCVMDPAGRRLKIPVWMLLPECAEIKISQQPHLAKHALLSLASLITSQLDYKDRVHDNLLQTRVCGCEEGRRDATSTADLMIAKECGAVPMDAATHSDLISLMVRVLVAVFHEEGEELMTGSCTIPKSNRSTWLAMTTGLVGITPRAAAASSSAAFLCRARTACTAR